MNAVPKDDAFNDALTRITSVAESPMDHDARHLFSTENAVANWSDLLDQSVGAETDLDHSTATGETKSEEVLELEGRLRQAAQLGQMLVEREEDHLRKIDHLKEENQRLEADLEDSRIDQTEAMTRADQMKEQLHDSQDKVGRLESKLRDSESAAQHFKEQVDDLQRQHTDLTEIHRTLQGDYRAQRDLMLSQISSAINGDGTALSPSKKGDDEDDASDADHTPSKDFGLMDTTTLVNMLKDLRRRNQSLQSKLVKSKDELQDSQRQLEVSERRSNRLNRELQEERKSSDERAKSHQYIQDLTRQLEKDRASQKEVIDKIQSEKDAIAGKMEAMSFSAMHYQKKWDEEKRLRTEENRNNETSADDVTTAGAQTPQTDSKSLFDELQRMQADNAAASSDGPSTEEPKTARDCNQEFFYLTCLSVKVGLATRYKTDLSSLRSAELFELSRKKRVPFHQYHHFIEQQVIADYRRKAIRQKETQEKKRAMLAQQQAERQKQLDAMNKRSRTNGSPGSSSGGQDGDKRTAGGVLNFFKEAFSNLHVPSVTNGLKSPRSQSRSASRTRSASRSASQSSAEAAATTR